MAAIWLPIVASALASIDQSLRRRSDRLLAEGQRQCRVLQIGEMIPFDYDEFGRYYHLRLRSHYFELVL